MAYAIYTVSNPKGKKKSKSKGKIATLLQNFGAKSKAAVVAFAKKQKNPSVLVRHSGKGSIPVRIQVKANPTYSVRYDKFLSMTNVPHEGWYVVKDGFLFKRYNTKAEAEAAAKRLREQEK